MTITETNGVALELRDIHKTYSMESVEVHALRGVSCAIDDNEYVDVGENLRAAFARNPHMRLFVAFGYYDAATPYYAAEYSLSHLRLPAALRQRISTGYYEAGHMMYIHVPSLAKLAEDVSGFVGLATTP